LNVEPSVPAFVKLKTVVVGWGLNIPVEVGAKVFVVVFDQNIPPPVVPNVFAVFKILPNGELFVAVVV
jgi:hypothetical protein